MAGLAGVGLLALAVAWFQRDTIARRVIDKALTDKGVGARYTIKAITTKTQRIEQLSVGDPARPDLTAEWIEIDTGSYLRGGTVTAIRASGVRLRGQVSGGALRFGVLDKLRPAPSDTPFRWPDILVSLRNAQAVIDSEWGPISLGINGDGNLANGFRGAVALAAPRLAQSDCRADGVRITGEVTITARKPRFVGPVAARVINCQQIEIQWPELRLDASLSETADGWTGTGKGVAASANGLGFSGSGITAKLDLAGNRVNTGGTIEAALATLSGQHFGAGPTRIAGSFAIEQGDKGPKLASQGRVTGDNIRPAPALLARAIRLGQGATGTPVAPISAQLARAIEGLGSGSSAQANYVFANQDGQSRLSLNTLNMASKSGVRLAVTGAAPITLNWPGGFRLDGLAQLTGGGFPTTRISLNDQGGIATVAPLGSGGARLSLAPLRFGFGRKTRLETVAVLDGPLGNGRINGLRIPINWRGGSSLVANCIALSYQSLTIAGLSLDRGNLPTCITGNQARIDGLQLAGRLGETPIRISGDRTEIKLGNGDFAITNPTVRLALKDDVSRLDATVLTGSLQRGGAKGRFQGLSGKLANVPVLVSQANGDWALQQGKLKTTASLQVSDAASAPRYQPLLVDDFALKLVNNQINATGTARHPTSGTTVSLISITHDLDAGRGHAVLDVPGIEFGQAIQPEDLTLITNGVIAFVKGRVAGRGDIDWGQDGVTSTGDFGTDSLNMAAAFGPVAGLSGRIRLSDLLGLVTDTPQTVKLASINPGIAVLDGEISYRLLPDLKAEILGGSWPFAGGRLSLQPTVMDLSTAATRRLTLKVEGLDAARFIAAMEFENISATGLFDGELPLIFDQDGGRIEGGRLVARAGGTLSYIGEISNENIGAMGRFAFDALKSIRYNRLSIDLDGNLGGDVITKIKFAGVNQGAIRGIRPKLPIPIKIVGLNNIPFIFNITITAKFRQLFDTARSINDPSILVREYWPKAVLTPVEKPKSVQPAESTKVR